MCAHLCIDFGSLSPFSPLEKGPILERDPRHLDPIVRQDARVFITTITAPNLLKALWSAVFFLGGKRKDLLRKTITGHSCGLRISSLSDNQSMLGTCSSVSREGCYTYKEIAFISCMFILPKNTVCIYIYTSWIGKIETYYTIRLNDNVNAIAQIRGYQRQTTQKLKRCRLKKKYIYIYIDVLWPFQYATLT